MDFSPIPLPCCVFCYPVPSLLHSSYFFMRRFHPRPIIREAFSLPFQTTVIINSEQIIKIHFFYRGYSQSKKEKIFSALISSFISTQKPKNTLLIFFFIATLVYLFIVVFAIYSRFCASICFIRSFNFYYSSHYDYEESTAFGLT